MAESEFLKDNVQNIQKLLTIPPLRRFETKSLKHLLRLSKMMEYMPGDLIIKEGDLDPWIYFLLSGKVKVKKGGIEIGILDKPGEMFGEMRLLDGMARSASVFAESSTVCLAINTAAATKRLTSDERADLLLLLYRIFTEYLAIRLRLLNDELVEARKEIEKFSGNGK